jgi:hypothetical protein
MILREYITAVILFSTSQWTAGFLEAGRMLTDRKRGTGRWVKINTSWHISGELSV